MKNHTELLLATPSMCQSRDLLIHVLLRALSFDGQQKSCDDLFNDFRSNHVCRPAGALLVKNRCTATFKFVEPISHGCHRW